jgi:hypothetical protein
MFAIIGGEPARFRPLIDLYREAGRRAGHSVEKLVVIGVVRVYFSYPVQPGLFQATSLMVVAAAGAGVEAFVNHLTLQDRWCSAS